MGQFAALESLHVLGVFLRPNQLVVAPPHEVEQIVEELRDIGSAYEIVQVEIRKALPEVDP